MLKTFMLSPVSVFKVKLFVTDLCGSLAKFVQWCCWCNAVGRICLLSIGHLASSLWRLTVPMKLEARASRLEAIASRNKGLRQIASRLLAAPKVTRIEPQFLALLVATVGTIGASSVVGLSERKRAQGGIRKWQ